MGGILSNIGLLAIGFVIICSYGKVLDYYDLKRPKLYASEIVNRAAEIFAEGASAEEIKVILTSCVEIDEEEVEKIIEQSLPHRNDKDGGYRFFIKSVNKVLGENQ